MKTIKLSYTFLLLLISVGMMTSCVKDDDFSLPDTSINPPTIDGDTISISGVKALFMQETGVTSLSGFNGDEQLTFEGTDKYMVGYVISSDEAGNFYQEMVVQDKPENPTSGIKIMLQANPLYTTFEIGRKVYIELDGFTIGFSNGVIALGVSEAGSDFVSKAPEAFAEKVIRTPVLDSIVPLELTISDFSRQYDNLFIRINDVEFADNLVTEGDIKTFAAEPGEQYDAERLMQTCSDESVTMITSTFADFKAMPLPVKRGSVDAVLTKTFNGSAYRIKVNDPSNFHFDQARCDGQMPEQPEPGNPTVVGMPFEEGFDGLLDYDNIALEGWTNQDVSGSTRVWQSRSFDSNVYAQLSAYNASSAVEAWLVTPGVDLTDATAPALSFETKDGHDNGAVLTVYVSTDFSGDVTQATWTQLNNVTISEGHVNGYGDSFITSGEVDLSSYIGQTVYVGFKYEGDPNGSTTTMQIDNIAVAESDGNGGGGGDATPPSANAVPVFAGADFEDWAAFTGGINQFGLQSYATESTGNGRNGSTALSISTPGTSGNDYVFTNLALTNLPSGYSKVQFYMKGSSAKSVSINLYKADGSYVPFNLGDVSGDVVIASSGNNQYSGTVDTNGEWVLVTLDLTGITDLNNTDANGDIFALKIGKEANYDLYFDEFTIE